MREQPALVFIHGWLCDRSYWAEQLPQFAEKYKVVAIDLAGHGESGLDREKWTIGAFAEDVAAVVNELNLEQVVLIGHSMGGNVILEAGRKMPQRVWGIVAVDALHSRLRPRADRSNSERHVLISSGSWNRCYGGSQ